MLARKCQSIVFGFLIFPRRQIFPTYPTRFFIVIIDDFLSFDVGFVNVIAFSFAFLHYIVTNNF